jgi:hypothetical protein
LLKPDTRRCRFLARYGYDVKKKLQAGDKYGVFAVLLGRLRALSGPAIAVMAAMRHGNRTTILKVTGGAPPMRH